MKRFILGLLPLLMLITTGCGDYYRKDAIERARSSCRNIQSFKLDRVTFEEINAHMEDRVVAECFYRYKFSENLSEVFRDSTTDFFAGDFVVIDSIQFYRERIEFTSGYTVCRVYYIDLSGRLEHKVWTGYYRSVVENKRNECYQYKYYTKPPKDSSRKDYIKTIVNKDTTWKLKPQAEDLYNTMYNKNLEYK